MAIVPGGPRTPPSVPLSNQSSELPQQANLAPRTGPRGRGRPASTVSISSLRVVPRTPPPAPTPELRRGRLTYRRQSQPLSAAAMAPHNETNPFASVGNAIADAPWPLENSDGPPLFPPDHIGGVGTRSFRPIAPRGMPVAPRQPPWSQVLRPVLAAHRGEAARRVASLFR